MSSGYGNGRAGLFRNVSGLPRCLRNSQRRHFSRHHEEQRDAVIQYAGSYRIAVNGDDGCWIASSAMLPRKDGVGGFAPVLAMAVFFRQVFGKDGTLRVS